MRKERTKVSEEMVEVAVSMVVLMFAKVLWRKDNTEQTTTIDKEKSVERNDVWMMVRNEIEKVDEIG